MAALQCEHLDGTVRCPYDVVHKCTGNWCHGGAYCAKHIQYLDSQYICDMCCETERVRRELAEATKQRYAREAKAAAVVARSLSIAHEKGKIRYPRILLPLSLIITVPVIILEPVIMPPGSAPLIYTSPLLAYTLVSILVLGGLLYVISLIWLLVIALGRGQKEWAFWFFFSAGIAILLYLILNPVKGDQDISR